MPLFAGSGLETNLFFDSKRFRFYDVPSLTPFGGKKKLLKAPWVLFRGLLQSLKVLKRERIALVVGFGSYHSFPLLLAAKLKRVPIVLFEPNAHPGKVNRLFSKGARFTALQFSEGKEGLKGGSQVVSALVRKMEKVSRKIAADYFSLDESKSTLLIFGGSQGALTINQYLFEITPHLEAFKEKWQILHFVGRHENTEKFRSHYEKLKITACVKPFEEKMARAWSLADLIVSRSGAATIAEQLYYGTPALFIPFPFATDDHQTKNASVIARRGGAIQIKQGDEGAVALLKALKHVMHRDNRELDAMSEALKAVKETQDQQHLSSLILKMMANE